MRSTAIYIDDQLADPSEDTIISCTFQAWNIGELKSRSATHTNRIKLPLTENNKRIFEFSQDVRSKSRKPYSSVRVRVVQNGIDIFKNGLGLLRQVNKEFALEVYDGFYDFFQIIKGKYVDEIDLGVYGPVDETFINGRRNNVSVGTPVVDYGRMFAPQQEIGNPNFEELGDDEFPPWQNTDIPSFIVSGVALWGVNTGPNISVILDNASPDNVSSYLDGPYKFYQGITYRVVISAEVISGGTSGTLQVEVHDSAGNFQVINTTSITSVADHIFDDTFTADNNYDLISIIASQITAGTDKEVMLKRIDIIPIREINIRPPFYLPAIGLTSVITEIQSQSGYSFTSQRSPGDSTHLDNLMITFSKESLRYNRSLLDKYDFYANASGSQNFNVVSGSPVKIQFTELSYNGVNSWFDGLDDIDIGLMDFDLRIKVFVKITVDVSFNSGASLVFGLRNSTSLTTDESGPPNFLADTVTADGEYTFFWELPITEIGQDTFLYNVAAIANPGVNADVSVLSGQFYLKVDDVPTGRIHISNLVLPHIRQSEFFADYLYRTGSLVNERGSVINLKTIQSIIERKYEATDWTFKRDASTPEIIDFLDSNYAQENFFSDSPDDKENAKGILEVENENLEEQKTVYNSPMIVPEEIDFEGIKIVRIPVFDFESEDPLTVSEDFEPGVRMFFSRFFDSADPEVKYNSVVKPPSGLGYSVAVYSDPLFEAKGTWQYFINRYYSGLKKSLDELKVVTRAYTLNEIDMHNLDLLTLIYDDGSYFIIISIPSYVEGKSTNVKLLKV